MDDLRRNPYNDYHGGVSMNLSLIVLRITLLIQFNFKTLQPTFTKNRLQTVNIQTVLNNCDGH